MTAFSTIPNLVITSDTRVIPDDGRDLRRAEGGEIRGRNAYSETVFRINAVVKGDTTVKQALETFYNANINDLNIINIDSTNYNSVFIEPPAVISKDGAIRWLSLNLLGFNADAPSKVFGVTTISGVGMIVVSTPKTIILTGVIGTSAVGSATIDAMSDVAVTGVTGTSAVDSVGVEAKANVIPSSLVGTSAVGAVTVSTP